MEDTKCKILLIEDDKFDRMAFIQTVEDKNLPYQCSVAGSISEARDMLKSERYDAVIVDYSLGDGTAFDILSSVEDTPVILVTGAGDEETAIKAWKAGAYDYLIKDIDRHYLKAVPITIENAIKHKKTKEQLQLLSGAIMNTDESVYITDTQNKIIFVNKAFCETYRYTEDEILGKDSNLLWIGKLQSENTRSVFRTRSVGSAWEVGFYHKRKDNSIFPVSLTRSIIRDENGKEVAVVGVARDISERIFVEDKLRTENLKLKKQNHLKDELAAEVAEQLKTPLAALKNVVNNAVTDSSGQISPELRESLQSADENIEKSTEIINDFLSRLKINSDKMEVEIS